MYSNEITNLNEKILDFGKLMDQLINENQRMKIKIEEFDKKEIYFRKQMKEFSKVKLLFLKPDSKGYEGQKILRTW